MITFGTFAPFYLLIIAACVCLFAWRYTLVDRTGKQKFVAGLLRVLAIICIVLAMCRPFIGQETNDVHVVYVFDVSRSVDLDDLSKQIERVEESIESLHHNDDWNIVLLADGTRSCSSLDELKKLLDDWKKGLGDESFRDATTISTGLKNVRFCLPGDKAGRIILMSDACNTDTKLTHSMNMLLAEGIDVRWWPVTALQHAEASVVSMYPSSNRCYTGEVLRFSVELAANANVNGTLKLIHRGVVIHTKQCAITKDKAQTIQFDMPMNTPGTSRWHVELEASKDFFTINNQASCVIDVHGEPRILMVHKQPKAMRDFARALRKQGFTVEIRDDHGVPSQLIDMLAFDGIILGEVSAPTIGAAGMELLRRYVADFGGGLAMFGSEESFGLGGYYRTPIEEVLPLRSRYEKEKEKPSLAMVLVIDKSGSMSGNPIALARQAAKSAVEVLSPQDQIAIIGFDGSPFLVCEMTSAADSMTIQSAIDGLVASGGTNMYPAMYMGAEMLESTVAKIKHMIVLGDGQSQAGDFMGITNRMSDAGVTVSTVALGQGSDQQLMAKIAEIGNGRTYVTMDPSDVPQIFTKETMEASRSAIKEDIFTAVKISEHPMMAGYDDDGLPMALGYVMTEAKPTAQVILSHDSGDPLLAITRNGLGVGMAFTADLTERWGGEWLAWDSCGKFWAQVLRSMVRNINANGIVVQQRIENQQWHIHIERKNEKGEPLSNVEWDALMLDDSGTELKPAVEEIGYGRYFTSVDLSGRKQATMQLRDINDHKSVAINYQQPYPAEYNLTARAHMSLTQLDALEPKDIRTGLEPVVHRSSMAHWFIWASILFMITGIVARRL